MRLRSVILSVSAIALALSSTQAFAAKITVQWQNRTNKLIVRQTQFDNCGGSNTICSAASGMAAGATGIITATTTGTYASIIYRYGATNFGTNNNTKYTCQMSATISIIGGQCSFNVYSAKGDTNANGSLPNCATPAPQYDLTTATCEATVYMYMDD